MVNENTELIESLNAQISELTNAVKESEISSQSWKNQIETQLNQIQANEKKIN